MTGCRYVDVCGGVAGLVSHLSLLAGCRNRRPGPVLLFLVLR